MKFPPSIIIYQHVQLFLIFVIVAFGFALFMGWGNITDLNEPWLDRIWQALLLIVSPGAIANYLRREVFHEEKEEEKNEEKKKIDTTDLSTPTT